MSKFIMDSPAVELLDYICVAKSSKGVAYVRRKCISLDMCTKISNKTPGATLQEQVHMT